MLDCGESVIPSSVALTVHVSFVVAVLPKVKVAEAPVLDPLKEPVLPGSVTLGITEVSPPYLVPYLPKNVWWKPSSLNIV